MPLAYVRSADPEAEFPPAPPVGGQDLGEPFEWCMRLPGQYERYVYASSQAELVGALLARSDYLDLDPQNALVARIKYSISTQCWHQARLNVVGQTTLSADWAQAVGWERDVLLGDRARQPHNWPTRALFDGRDTWTCRIPLILVSTAFAPYSDIPAPDGNVWWLDPIDDISLLASFVEQPLHLIDIWRVETV